MSFNKKLNIKTDAVLKICADGSEYNYSSIVKIHGIKLANGQILRNKMSLETFTAGALKIIDDTCNIGKFPWQCTKSFILDQTEEWYENYSQMSYYVLYSEPEVQEKFITHNDYMKFIY